MPQPPTTEFAPAKINLTLHVTGQRADGYHLLDSLVVFCGIGDSISVTDAPALGLTIIGPQAHLLDSREDNLVLRAARMLSPDRGAALILDKRLPVASGIGGGSSDAAATLRALSRHWGIALPETTAQLALGADVPVCMGARPARMRGIGDRLEKAGPLPELHIVLVNPSIAVPTPAVFQALSNKQNPGMPPSFLATPDARVFANWLSTQRNDLEAPARAIAPGIGAVLAALASQSGALIARMSGSGATCFALFETEVGAKAAADQLATAHPQWWTASGPVLA